MNIEENCMYMLIDSFGKYYKEKVSEKNKAEFKLELKKKWDMLENMLSNVNIDGNEHLGE